MGWTGCFPRGDNLRRLPRSIRRSSPWSTATAPAASIGVDIGKDVFHVGKNGKIAFGRKIKRLALLETFRDLPPSVVGMEASLSAHFVSRVLRQLGHEPRIIPAFYVKPFVKGQKNDYTGALVMLGLGWNFLYIGGTTLLTTTYWGAEKGRAQATNDMTIFAVGLACSFSAGALLQTLGWQTLNLMLLPWLAAATGALLWFGHRSRQTVAAVAAE